jgi:hypothetical protein
MLRKLIALFVLCFCVCLASTYLMFHYWAGLSLDMRILQIVILASLLLTNAIYLCSILYKIDPWLMLIVALIYYSFDFIYERSYKNMDERLKSLYLLAGLLVTTIIVHFIQKKSSPR